jgi:hypothetical protein
MRVSMRVRTLAAFLLLASTTALQAQGTERWDTLRVGRSSFSPLTLRDDSARFRVLMASASDSAGAPYATSTIVQRLVTDPKGPAILRVSTFTFDRGTIIDSVRTLRRGLVPIWESSTQPTKTMILRFDGAHVTGSVTPKDSATRAVDQTTPIPVYNSTDFDLVVASLPLAADYRVLFPNFVIESGGLVMDTIRVTGTARVQTPRGMRDAWLIEHPSGSRTSVMWIDRDTREMLRQELRFRNGRRLMFVRE